MESKWVGNSLTIWGGLIGMLPVLGPMVGFDVTDITTLGDTGTAAINGLAAVVAFLMVVRGRFNANTNVPVRMVL